LQISALDFSNFTGRIAIGRLYQGMLKQGDQLALSKKEDKLKKVRIKELHVFEGLGKRQVTEVQCGDIVAVTGLEDFDIGDTLTDFENPQTLSRIEVDAPTISALFAINDSPFFGKEGKFVTSRHLRDRLFKETEKNLALIVKETDTEDKFLVYGRGVLHLSVLIETMRREGYEFQVGQPQVLFQEDENGQKTEPFELMVVDVPEEFSGKVIEYTTKRKGELKVMEPKGSLQHLEFEIPSRGLIGLRNQILTATSGEAVMTHRFLNYQPYKGDLPTRNNGSLVSLETGPVTGYALDKLQDRGRYFVDPGEEIYRGQVVGEHNRVVDLEVNLQKGKKLTNMRASGSDTNVKIAPKLQFSLEETLEYIKGDEYVEITPENIRMRKIKFK
jgi:GTP-binding protein